MSSRPPPAAAWLARAALALLGSAAIAWAAAVLPVFRFAVPIRDVSEGIIADKRFKPDVLDGVRAQFAAQPQAPFEQPVLLRAKALVSLRAAEEEMDRQGPAASDRAMDAADMAVKAALTVNPKDSFLWLMLYSLQTTRNGFDPANIALLDQSYATGPREGWIALRRNGLALAVLPASSSSIQDNVIAEFDGMVDSGLIEDAAINLTSIGWVHRERLLASLIQVNLLAREALAKRLVRDGVKVAVPGVHLDERLWR
jgi:hypothetical protein